MSSVAMSPTPVPLSANAELERQERVASALAQLLVTAAPSSSPGLRSVLSDADFQGRADEIEELRCKVHLGDLENCKSQQRLMAIQFAVTHDDALQAEELLLSDAEEADRQRFYNDIYKRVKECDLSSFAFNEAEYQSAWDHERAARSLRVAASAERLSELLDEHTSCVGQRLAECGEAVANFQWSSLAATQGSLPGDNRWRTHIDALTMESSEDLWFVAEASPTQAVDAGLEARNNELRDLLLIVDLSGSMCNVLPVLKECLHDVLARAYEGDRVCIIGFDSDPRLLCDWTELRGHDTRRLVRNCIEAMRAHGGTRIVPALDLASIQLSAREASGTRAAAVVLLSDGDPEEPADALASAATRTFSTIAAAAAAGNVALVALSLGEESRPDLMALVAQCGRGVSLYISDRNQLPSQLGRMWGLLGGGFDSGSVSEKAAASSAAGTSPICKGTCGRAQTEVQDCFLVLEPTEGAEIVETERSPGGVATLTSSDGRRLTVLRCGRSPPPSDNHDGSYRLAARLRLPAWAAPPVEKAVLQRPLLRATWVWQGASFDLADSSCVHAASEILRTVQVPSLLVEARLGLPLRVVMSGGGTDEDCESVDRSAFVGALAAALGIEEGRLALGRLTPGSIIADLHLLSAEAQDVEKIQLASTSVDASLCGGGSVHQILRAVGFEVKEIRTPGASALNRMLQWRLAAALEAAANGQSCARELICNVQALACSDAARAYADVAVGGAAAVAADAAAALEVLEQPKLSPAAAHALAQQAHAHCQQLCPELMPSAAAVRCYETETLRQPSLAFESNALLREELPPPAAMEVSARSADALGALAVHVRCPEAGPAASAVIIFMATVSCAERSTVIEIPIRAGAAAEGVLATVPAIEPGEEHSVVFAASNGRRCGPQSASFVWRATAPPLVRSDLLPSAAANIASSTPSRTRQSRLRNSSSNASLGSSNGRLSCSSEVTPVVHILSASATQESCAAVLVWDLLHAGPPATVQDIRWVVTFTGRTVRTREMSKECHTERRAQFDGLEASATYNFRVAPLPSSVKSMPASPLGLSVQGTAMGRGPMPAPVEGVLVMPPYAPAALAELEADANMRPLGPGAFLWVGGTRPA